MIAAFNRTLVRQPNQPKSDDTSFETHILVGCSPAISRIPNKDLRQLTLTYLELVRPPGTSAFAATHASCPLRTPAWPELTSHPD